MSKTTKLLLLFLLVLIFKDTAHAFERNPNERPDNFIGLKPTLLIKTQKLPIQKRAENHTDFITILEQADQAGLSLRNINSANKSLYVQLHLQNRESAPKQIGHALRILHNNAASNIEEFVIQSFYDGLSGTYISIIRKDFEKALMTGQTSPEEIWKNTEITETHEIFNRHETSINLERNPILDYFSPAMLNLTLRNKLSLGKGRRDVLYRSDVVVGYKKAERHERYTRLQTTSLAFNLKNNLDRLYLDVRPVNLKAIRSDEDIYAEQTMIIDRLYDSVHFKVTEDTHALIGAGYIDEGFLGVGGEVLKRPLTKNWSIGLEGYFVDKRSPISFGALGIEDQKLWTAHAKFTYDIPKYDMRLGLRTGAYLDGDIGATASLTKNFSNGAKLEGFTTMTNKKDYDNFGDQTNLEAGLRLVMPLGGLIKPFKFQLDTDTSYKPFVRDSGQFIDPPFQLIDLTEKVDQAHVEKYWNELID